MEVSLAGAGAGRRTDARAGGRPPVSPPSVAEGASLRQVVVEHSDGGGHGSHESSEPALLAELSSLLADTRLRYDGLTDGGVPVSPAAYTVTVYSAPAEKGRTFGVDSQGRVYQDNRRYSASPEQVEELTALLERICS